KYKRNEVQNGVLAKQSDSNLWKAIVNLWPKLDDNSFWSIRDGRSIAFCHQKWINTDIRISELNIHIPELIWNAKVSDLVDDRGRWNWELLNGWLPESILHQIAAVPPPDDSAGPDQCICIGVNNHKFSIAAMYQALCKFDTDSESPNWKQWKTCTTPGTWQ
ncbi:putative ribonuclease H protein, partial [Trifolium medium]|nr:putative ribonuclease H protein [Trifolium medium]